MISFYRSRCASIFEFRRSLPSVAGRGQDGTGQENRGERYDDGNVAGVFQTGVYQRRQELCFGLCQRARSLSPYTTGPISMRTTKRGRGPLVFLVPLGLLLRPSEPPSPYLSLTNIASLRVSLAVSPLSLSPPLFVSLLSLFLSVSLLFLPLQQRARGET